MSKYSSAERVIITSIINVNSIIGIGISEFYKKTEYRNILKKAEPFNGDTFFELTQKIGYFNEGLMLTLLYRGPPGIRKLSYVKLFQLNG